MRIEQLFSTHSDNQIVRPYVIAEAGVNHEGEINLAKKQIELAHEGGADAIKFQSYKASTLACKASPSYWDTSKEPTRSQYDLFRKYDKFWKKEFEELKKHCDNVGIEFLSTPFDLESARFLNDLVNSFKISSSDITNKPFLQYISSLGKPVILSTGASSLDEVANAVSWISKNQVQIALLHCVLNYPTDNENANLGMIKGLSKEYPDKIIGYSDHTLPGDMGLLELAVAFGAKIIEKHFTHNKLLPGNDHYHAMDVNDLLIFNKRLDEMFIIYGSEEKDYIESEVSARQNARRSLVSTKKIPQGAIIKSNDLTWKRPASGISPQYVDKVIGMTANVDISEDTPVQWEMLLQ